MSDTRKRAEIVSSFTDHGTGESFTAGDTRLIEAGAFANYEAAGLVRTPATATKAAPAPKPASKPKTAAPKSVSAAPASAPTAESGAST